MSSKPQYKRIVVVLIAVTAILALYPVVRTVADWVRVSRVIATPIVDAGPRSYDWVAWEDDDGQTKARYVHPAGPASAAGLRSGDVLYLLDFQQYFTDADVRNAIEGVPPGTSIQYTIVRGEDHVDVEVGVTRYPTFLYPLSATLWGFSLWGFAVAAFIHILGLIIAVPLALHSREARFSLALICVSALWIFGNLARIFAVEFLGAPIAGSAYDAAFYWIAVVSLVGWIAFPTLLAQRVIGDAFKSLTRSAVQLLLLLPPIVLTLIAVATLARNNFGPFTLDELVGPILFYASCYIALSAAMILVGRRQQRVTTPDEEPAAWSVRGSQVTLVVAVLVALTIAGVIPLLADPTQVRAGWFVVSAQLLSTAPIILVSLATLRYGRMDVVVRRALGYTLTGGLLFFLLVVGLGVIDSLFSPPADTRSVVAALFAVVMVFVLERAMRLGRRYASSVFPSDRQRTARLVGQFQDSVRDVIELPALLKETVDLVGEAFDTRSAVIFVRSPIHPDEWISANYHPEPPYVTDTLLKQIWPSIAADREIWAYNAALNRSSLPVDISRQLIQHGAAVAIPIVSREGALGLVVMGRKRERGAVFNLEDIDQLVWLSGQLALAVERVKLIERHNLLAKETAQAQLVALRSQINPHFLFNALNTIMALIDEKPDQAERTLDHLSSIFRHILAASDRTFVTLDEELSLVHHYLAIEQARFGDNLEIQESIEPGTRNHPVPAFAIQTIVENAVKHGLERKLRGGLVDINVTRDGDGCVSVRVSDTGVGIPALFDNKSSGNDRSYFGIGLNNVALRTEQLFGRTDLFDITSVPGQGTTVVLRIPETTDSES